MSWILDHLQLAIALVIGAAVWIKRVHADAERRRFKKEVETNPGRSMSSGPPPLSESDAAERTRQIQEEIRRKIAARTKQTSAEAKTKYRERVLERATNDPFSSDELRKNASWEAPLRPASDEKNQEALHQEADRLREVRRSTLRKARELRDSTISAGHLPAADVLPLDKSSVSREEVGQPWAAWKAQLTDPDSLRRAIVLNEILGPPVGLR